MSTIFDSHPENVFNTWMKYIKKKNEYSAAPISIMISAKLIVFAWTYATYQAHELKDRLGNLNIVETTESIFINKLAQIAYAVYNNYSDEDILTGKSCVHLDPSSLDERYNVNMNVYAKGKPLVLSGTKKFLFPIVPKNCSSGYFFVYIDAVRLHSTQKTITRLNIANGHIKVTLLGYATKTDIKQNQEQEMMLEYSNKLTAFTGFHLIRPTQEVTYIPRTFNVPKYVEELQCYENIESKLETIIQYIKNSHNIQPITQINYAALFDDVLRRI